MALAAAVTTDSGSQAASLAFRTNTTFQSTAGFGFAPQGYGPTDIQTAYGVAPLLDAGTTGSGQTIALIEFDKFASSDLAAFDSQFNLPDPSVQQYYLGGATATRMPSQGEAALDIEWAHAMAPDAAIQVYNLPNVQATAKGWQLVASAVDQAVANGAGTVSMSFGACGPSSGYKTLEASLASALKKGVSVFVASGDDGALSGPRRDCGGLPAVGYPASDPSVVSVGGTSLLLDQAGSITNEVSWRLSGGGKGKPLARPSWQIASTLKPGKYRYVPDVSFIANPSTGVAVYFRGGWQTAGGTSLGAPAWAGIWALVRQAAETSGIAILPAPQSVYKIANSSAYSQAFHDITSGNNGQYVARVGWDAVTGWGTPNAQAMATAVQSLATAQTRQAK